MRQPEDLFAPYNADACRICGGCLAACPVVDVDLATARKTMADLREGKRVAWVERRCQTCLACNLACPDGNNPMQLILTHFARTIREKGPRRWGRYFQQQQPDNFRRVAASKLPEEDRELLDTWRDETPVEEITYPGCNVSNTPWLTRTKLLDGHDIRGGFDLCCGEPFFRTGMEDELRQCARRLNAWLGRLGVKRMTVLCTAGVCLFRYVLPQYGLTHKMEVRPILETLYDDFQAGKYEVVAPQQMKVTVQESCYGKVLGPDYMRKVRDLLAMIGCEVVEMQHHGEQSLCCGIGAGFPPTVGYHPAALMRGAVRVWREAGKTGAERLVTYCSGCLLTLSAMGLFYPPNLGATHLFDLLACAVGEPMPDRIAPIGRSMIGGAVRKQFPRLVDFGRSHLEPFEP